MMEIMVIGDTIPPAVFIREVVQGEASPSVAVLEEKDPGHGDPGS